MKLIELCDRAQEELKKLIARDAAFPPPERIICWGWEISIILQHPTVVMLIPNVVGEFGTVGFGAIAYPLPIPVPKELSP